MVQKYSLFLILLSFSQNSMKEQKKVFIGNKFNKYGKYVSLVCIIPICIFYQVE